MNKKATTTAELRGQFVTNLQQLMNERGYTLRETARHAGITDVKRFYRWASKGISRATHEHEADLERLRELFRLRSIGQFWEPQHVRWLHDKIMDAGAIEWEYEYAFKLLVTLRSLGETEAKQLCGFIEGRYESAVMNQSPEEIMMPKAAAEILSFLHINAPQTYERLVGQFGSEAEAVERLRKPLEKGAEVRAFIDYLIKRR